MSDTLGSSSHEEALLRVVALWAADCAEEALVLFEARHPGNMRPREAIEASREFGRGKKRDNALRVLSLTVFKLAKELDEPSKHVVCAASLAAAVAYTHTDLQQGLQGIRQARHVLGPAVHAACALELAAANGDGGRIASEIIHKASRSAPVEVSILLEHFPPQPKEGDRLNMLFVELDEALRGKQNTVL